MAMLQGPIAWAKITGKPQPGYTKTQLEWSFDIGVTPEVEKALLAAEVSTKKYVKPATNDKGKTHTLGMDYIKFTRREVKADGELAKPIKVVDRKGQPWPEGKMIGNGSIVNVKFMVNKTQNGDMKPSVVAVQVWELKEFEGAEEFPVDENGNEDW